MPRAASANPAPGGATQVVSLALTFRRGSYLAWLAASVVLVGLRRAQELLYTSRVLSAEEAAEWGLVNASLEDRELPSQVNMIAERLESRRQAAAQLARDAADLKSP